MIRLFLKFLLVKDPFQWRIQEFPDGDTNPLVWGKNLLFREIFAENCRGGEHF